MSSKKILYCGRFEMPDKDATAHRVRANGKLLSDLGYEVIFFGWSSDMSKFKETDTVKTEYEGFTCYEKPSYRGTADRFVSIFDASKELKVISEIPDLYAVICYNFPSVAMNSIFRACKKRGIKCIADVTEWYGQGSKNILTRITRSLDSSYRMNCVHKKADGLIVISNYLMSFYSDCTTLLLPPLVDSNEEKWEKTCEKEKGKIVYAGSPSSTKEGLDSLVDAVTLLAPEMEISLNIIGIDEKAFRRMYNYEKQISDKVSFKGRVPHTEALKQVKEAEYTVVIRESNRVTNASFSSKFAESVTCGTPVICTDISDLSYYVNKYSCGHIVKTETLAEDLRNILNNSEKRTLTDTSVFDYRKYSGETENFLRRLDEK